MTHLTNAELRLDLAEICAQKSNSIRAVMMRRNRIKAITAELVQRGAF